MEIHNLEVNGKCIYCHIFDPDNQICMGNYSYYEAEELLKTDYEDEENSCSLEELNK